MWVVAFECRITQKLFDDFLVRKKGASEIINLHYRNSLLIVATARLYSQLPSTLSLEHRYCEAGRTSICSGYVVILKIVSAQREV